MASTEEKNGGNGEETVSESESEQIFVSLRCPECDSSRLLLGISQRRAGNDLLLFFPENSDIKCCGCGQNWEVLIRQTGIGAPMVGEKKEIVLWVKCSCGSFGAQVTIHQSRLSSGQLGVEIPALEKRCRCSECQQKWTVHSHREPSA